MQFKDLSVKYGTPLFVYDTDSIKLRIKYLFMQDGAPCHTSRDTMEFLWSYEILPIFWPANSCDLNPIENLWSIIINKLTEEDKARKESFEAAILRVWDEIPMDLINKLTDLCEKRW